MSLMKLSPETVRLRRIAKACAAGEFSQNEYRAARREVIENFRVPRVGDDDTQTRQVPLDRKPQVVPLVTEAMAILKKRLKSLLVF